VALEAGETPDPEDVAFLEGRIHDETLAAVGHGAARELAVFDRDPGGAIIGGVYGFTWAGTCDLLHLWVHPDHRRRGRATALLDAAEAEAARRGCRRVVLFTHGTQAPELYRRRGYDLVGEVPDYPAGDTALWFCRSLPPAP
jgi:ribosomal protein S18 acetylase RimI-like enzyme